VDDDTNPRRPARRPAALVFRSADGGSVFASTFSRTWVPARTRVGLPPRWGFHGLRHYYATLLIHAGATVKTVQLVLDRTRALVDGALGVGNGGHVGWEPSMTAVTYVVPKIRSASIRAGQGIARGQTL
jgi:hypothetical protein